MTLTAQQHCILGAMCIDETFRLQLFAAGEAPPAGRRTAIAALIQTYAGSNSVTIEDSVVDNVMNVVAQGSPCRDAAKDAFAQVKFDVCPCWPCF